MFEKLLFWKNNPAHDRFAQELLDQFTAMFPERFTEGDDKKARAKLDRTLSHMKRRVHEYSTTHELNIYSRARIGNRFMWGLREKGYDDTFSENVTNILLHAFKFGK